jgi:hypothetical protein
MNAGNTHHVVDFADCTAVAVVLWCHPKDMVHVLKIVLCLDEGSSSIHWPSLRLIWLM